MKKIVIFGTARFAELAHYYFTYDSDQEVVAFSVDAAFCKESHYKGLPIVPFEEIEKHYPPSECGMFVAIGIAGVNTLRAEKVRAVEAKGYQLTHYLSPKAEVAHDLLMQPNTMIMAGVLVHPYVQIGRNVIIWSRTVIGFRSEIQDHCWLAGPLVGETVKIGSHTFVGQNATLASFVEVGKFNIIGAGSLITLNTKDDEVYAAKPTRASAIPSHQLWE